MKKKLLFLSFAFFSLGAVAQTSVYHPFPDSGAVWIMNWTHWCTSSSTGCYLGCNSHYQYRVGGDTILAGNTYKKIIKETYLSQCICNMINPWTGTPTCSQQPFYSDFWFGIRNDSINKLVYKADGLNPEQVIYNFNLNVGDTIHSTFCNSPIVKIDSVLVGSDYRKCYWLDTVSISDNNRIIEGIGHVGTVFGGPFDPCGACVCDWMWGFSCFMQNGNLLYGNSSCALVTAADQITHEENFIIISPNPATNQLTVRSSEFGEIDKVEIYNILSKKIFSQYPMTSSRQQFTIDISFFNAGIYFVKVKEKNKETVIKLIKE